MNSQDKPIEANDNLDPSLEILDAIDQGESDLTDLWSDDNEDAEIVTEFISVETAAKNDAEALAEIVSSEHKVPSQPKKDISLDLDDWDFRNPPEPNLDESEANLEVDVGSELRAKSEIDDLTSDDPQQQEWIDEVTLKPDMDSLPDLDQDNCEEIDDWGGVESLVEEPISELSLDDLDEPILSLDDSGNLELSDTDTPLPEFDALDGISSLTEEPISESSLDDLDEPILSLDDSGNLELSDTDTPLPEFDALDDMGSLTEEPISESSLDDLDEPILSLDDSVNLELSDTDTPLPEFDALDGISSLTEEPISELSLDDLDEPILSLDDSVNLELSDTDTAPLELDERPRAAERRKIKGLPAYTREFEDLGEIKTLNELEDNDLDGLLDLDSEPESLDALMMEPAVSLDESEILGSLDSNLEATDLDSLLTDEPQIEPPSSPIVTTPNPVISQSIASPVPSPVKAQAFDQTMRVSVRKLDNLNNLIGELVVKRNRLEDDQERLRRFLDNLLGHVQSLGEAGAKMHDMYERSLLEGALMASRQSRTNAAVAAGVPGSAKEQAEEGLDALEMDRFTGFHLLSQDIIELIVRVREAASDIQFVVDETDKVAQTFRQVTSQLQDGMNSSRMVAFGQTADRLPRAVRDISRKQKKQTQLHVEGKDVLIDKMIVEHLYNPMTHLVNNAISHGIEKPEERLKKGKPEAGNVYIRAFLQGNQTVITVRDDGAGIDPEVVKKKAIEKNLITWATAQSLSDQQVYELLFHPGFSTKDQADDFAGRGVGMDVVNTDLKKIRGSISTESEIGKGTTFTVRLPLVLSICKALTCVNDNTKIAFPIDGVEDTKEYLPNDIQTNANGVRCVNWKDTLLPLRPLSGLLNYNRQIRRTGIYNANQNNDDTVSVVILRSLDNLLAVEVDEIKTEQEIVIKQIDGPIAKPPGIAGATVLGDGTIMPIGDVLELIEIAQGKRTIEIGFNILAGEGAIKQAQAESIQQEPMVLVVDDSITVRELLSMSFNKLGYRVEQARDGQEAWDKLRGGLVCDMIFSDIEMPRMNGLELLSNLHHDSNLKSIPVAMLTSRGADKHRQIASDLGAKAYLTKPYTEKDLMDVAQHLIEINQANKEAKSATVNIKRVKSNTEFENAPLVLIIDDSVTVRELLSMSFKKAGYRVEQARDGQEAWEKLSDGLDCDLAFCDIEMPRMNGLELLSQLQKDEKLASLPIAMLTSRGAQKMRNIAASRGANGYFVKPYVEEDLLKAATKMMNGEILIESESEEA
ncbi:MAG: response regulator [Cyanobacteria bacterium P01_A01_bin.83]